MATHSGKLIGTDARALMNKTNINLPRGAGFMSESLISTPEIKDTLSDCWFFPELIFGIIRLIYMFSQTERAQRCIQVITKLDLLLFEHDFALKLVGEKTIFEK